MSVVIVTHPYVPKLALPTCDFPISDSQLWAKKFPSLTQTKRVRNTVRSHNHSFNQQTSHGHLVCQVLGNQRWDKAQSCLEEHIARLDTEEEADGDNGLW